MVKRGDMMSNEHKKVFVSYDWGTPQHEQWVFDLVADLRRDGVDALLDKLITQTSTVQLERMMIDEIKSSDHVIIVLTKNYASKSDSMEGGVGFETLLTLPDLQSNPDKLIFILRHEGNFKDAVPYHLRGFYFINFSKDSEYKNKYNELLFRIENVPLYEMTHLGKKKELRPQTLITNIQGAKNRLFSDISLPKSKEFSDLEKDEFISNTYNEMINLFNQMFSELQEENTSFRYTNEQISHQKNLFKIYVDGNLKTGFKIWRGSRIFEGINFQFGRMLDVHSDNTLNESLTFNYNENGEVTLKLMMNMRGNSEFDDTVSVVKHLWSRNIEPHLKE